MPTHNKLTDLNDHLFEQIERLNDPELKGAELSEEINRSKAMAQLAAPIVSSAKVYVDALKLIKGRDGSLLEHQLSGIINIKPKQIS